LVSPRTNAACSSISIPVVLTYTLCVSLASYTVLAVKVPVVAASGFKTVSTVIKIASVSAGICEILDTVTTNRLIEHATGELLLLGVMFVEHTDEEMSNPEGNTISIFPS